MTELPPCLGPFARTLGVGSSGCPVDEWYHVREWSPFWPLVFPKPQGCLSHTCASPRLFKPWTRLRSAAAGAGLKGAAGAVESPGWPESVHRTDNPGEEADPLGPRLLSWEPESGLGLREARKQRATALGCLAPPAVPSPSLLCK